MSTSFNLKSGSATGEARQSSAIAGGDLRAEYPIVLPASAFTTRFRLLQAALATERALARQVRK